MEARSAKRRRQVDQLYELWDVNASGYLELDEIHVVLNKWRSDGIDNFKEGALLPVYLQPTKITKLNRRYWPSLELTLSSGRYLTSASAA